MSSPWLLYLFLCYSWIGSELLWFPIDQWKANSDWFWFAQDIPLWMAAVEALLHEQLRHSRGKQDSRGSEQQTLWVMTRWAAKPTPSIHADPQWFHCHVNGHVNGQLGCYLQPLVALMCLVCPQLRFSFSLFLSALGKLQLNAEDFRFKYFKSELFAVLNQL